MEKALLIKTDGSREVLEFEVGDSYDLLSSSVGGLIECVTLDSKSVDMWVNEEGKYICEYQNPIGTALYDDEFDAHDYIMGDIVLARSNDEGETIGLTDEQLDLFSRYNRNLANLSVKTHPDFYTRRGQNV
mgnify:CR=1 FL=1